MSLSFGGGAGVLTIPGLTSDGANGIDVAANVDAATYTKSGQPLVPSGLSSDGSNGIVVQRAVTAGDSTASSFADVHLFNGEIEVQDNRGNLVDGDIPLLVRQTTALLAGDTGTAAIYLNRRGSVAAQDYAEPALHIVDGSASAQDLLLATKGANPQFGIETDGIRVYGKFKTDQAVAHVLGAYSGNAVPVYDGANTLLGYLPLYA